ncbi:MAG: RHS repeat-associated core domain-containing protein, partial [Capsulimonadaceae bacterium]|nr:RHS repeat-associated core domain-containing protein [Capsulimonadaceae bacterium]
TTLPSTVYLFAGEGGVRLDPSGQYDMRAREYDASIMARFLSRDPLWGDEGGWNWYVYAGNDPVGRWDPSGFGPVVGATRPCPSLVLKACKEGCKKSGGTFEGCTQVYTQHILLGIRWRSWDVQCACPPTGCDIDFTSIVDECIKCHAGYANPAACIVAKIQTALRKAKKLTGYNEYVCDQAAYDYANTHWGQNI